MILIGTIIKPYGRVSAIANGVSYGERYYFFTDKYGSVSMIPAKLVEGSL
jgi:hypothetical protein